VTRAVTFWNDETIELIQKNFVAASVPTSIARADTAEGEFLRSADIHKQWVTSSGYMSCVSASGIPLGRAPCEEVLAKFKALPESARRPGAVTVPELMLSDYLVPSPPEGGMVLRVHARFLHRDDNGELRRATTSDFPQMSNKPKVMAGWERFLQPNTEYMWLTKDEWQALVPTNPNKGDVLQVDAAIAERMARFHLTPRRATTSEAGIIRKQWVDTAHLKLTVTNITAQQIQMDVSGFVHWGSDYDASQATTPNGPLAQGFETPLYGRAEYDRVKKKFTRLDIVAPGDVWGRWGDANNRSMYVERPGRNPFGFAFEMATGDSPSDRIPPGGNGRYINNTGYFAPE